MQIAFFFYEKKKKEFCNKVIFSNIMFLEDKQAVI